MDITKENMNPQYWQPAVAPIQGPTPPTIIVNQQGPGSQMSPENYETTHNKKYLQVYIFLSNA